MKSNDINGNMTTRMVWPESVDLRWRANKVNGEIGIEEFLAEILIAALSCGNGYLTERGHYEQRTSWMNSPGVQIAFRDTITGGHS
ncbi:MAG: hypothetical protein IPI01_21480 [Ignavibacteriae bacterium]|nr:hypothetical protein [Ignavibacteriota bacterium]